MNPATDTSLHFTTAFRLGRILEELASINRKQVAIETIRSMDAGFENRSILSTPKSEIDLARQQIASLCVSLVPRVPGRLVEICQKIENSDPTGMGQLDVKQMGVWHAAAAGLIEETMPRRTLWNCLQMGRLTQRSWLLISNIRDTLEGHRHMPDNSLLAYIALRTDNPTADLKRGTHLWNVHRVFHDVIKQEKNPKSLMSTLNRLYPHLSALPLPEALKRDHDNMLMTLNRITNDLSFIDVHEMIGDDPEDHLHQIMDFFTRHQRESEKLSHLIQTYLELFETYIRELTEDEVFEFEL